MNKLISTNEMKDLSQLIPSEDNKFTKEQVQKMLNQKADYYNHALNELKSVYQALEIQEQENNEKIKQLKEQSSQDNSDLQSKIDEYNQKINEYDQKINEYNNNSQLLTQLTVEARSTINDAKEKAKKIEQDATNKAQSIEHFSREESKKVRDDADAQANEIIESAKTRAKNYEEELINQANKDAEKIVNDANEFKENQEKELNQLRDQVIEANDQIIQDGSDKAKSLITRAQEKANQIIDEAQEKYNAIAHEINQTKKAGTVITKKMKELSEAFDEIKELESYKLIKDVSNKTQSKQTEGHSTVPVHQQADTKNVHDNDINKKLEKESEQLSNNDVRNVLNDPPEKIEINQLTDSQIDSMPDAIKNSLKLKKELTEDK